MDQKPPPQLYGGRNGLIVFGGGCLLAILAAVYLTDRPTDNVPVAKAPATAEKPVAEKSAPHDPATLETAADTAPEPVKSAPNASEKAASAEQLDPAAASATSAPDTTPTKTAPLNTGEMQGFVYQSERTPMADVAFIDGKGQAMNLTSFKGKTVLLNLWATWCAPCRHEMPALDRLEGQLGSDKFEVVALSLDRAGLKASQKFLDEIKVQNLKTYADPTTKASAPLKVIGMPTTILIDTQGREVGRLIGPAEWDTDDAVKLIKAVIDE